MIYAPVYRRVLWGGVEVSVYGTSRNWNYAGSSHEEMEISNPWITSAIRQVITDHDIRRALVPKPAFNTRVVKAEDLTKELLPGFFRGADADGVLLERSGDAYFLASADCPCVVIYDRSQHRLLGLHCGLNSLIDRYALMGKPKRQFASVIDGGMSLFKSVARTGLEVFFAVGIGSGSFEHPIIGHEHSAENTALINHIVTTGNRDERHFSVVKNRELGNIDLFDLVRAQLSNLGILPVFVEHDGHNTATNKYHDGSFMFHSNRRDHDKKRNLVVVKLL